MRTVGERKYFTEAEAISLSGLDADAISLCATEGVVSPLNRAGEIEFIDRDVLLLRAISAMLKTMRVTAATQELRGRFGLPEWSRKPLQQKSAEVNVLHRIVEKLLLSNI